MTRDPKGQSPHPLNKLMMMLTHPKAELFALSALAPTPWPKIASRVTQRGWLAENGGSTTKYCVFGVTGLDISHQSTRETTQGSKRQCQPPPQANKKCGTACHQGVWRWIWLHGFSRLWLLADIGEQVCMLLLPTEGSKPDGRTLKSRGYGRIKLDVSIAEPIHIDTLIIEGQLLGFELLFGIDAIIKLGRVYITKSGEVRFLERHALMCYYFHWWAWFLHKIWSS